MKVFVADNIKKGYVSETNYMWCDAGEILTFSHFTLDNDNSIDVSMCGIKTHKFTTHIIVKDLNISHSFYKELLIDSIEESFECKVNENGDYIIDLGFQFKFNINNLIEELIEKANRFENGDKLICKGRNLTKISNLHKCKLIPYGTEEKKCIKCGYITWNANKTDNEIIEDMIKAGYPVPDCDK